MFESAIKGWNIFTKKATFWYALLITIIFAGISYLFQGYINSIILFLSEQVVDIKLIHYVSYLLINYPLDLLSLLGYYLGSLFIINLLIYTLAKGYGKNKSASFAPALRYTLLLFIITLAFGMLFAVLFSYINIITIILIVLLLLFTIAAFFVLTFGIIYLGINGGTITSAMNSSWNLVKKRFWAIIGFMILVAIVCLIILYAVDFLFGVIFFYNEIASQIIMAVISILFTMYSINAMCFFANKYSKEK